MTGYFKCPRCQTDVRGYHIYQCSCKAIFCMKDAFTIAHVPGCGVKGCPRCGKQYDARQVGYIKF